MLLENVIAALESDCSGSCDGYLALMGQAEDPFMAKRMRDYFFSGLSIPLLSVNDCEPKLHPGMPECRYFY